MGATNFNNYGVYEQLARTGYQEINTREITNQNINSHIVWIVNILRDGIETDEVQSMKIHVTFGDGYSLYLYITNYWFNLIWWKLIVGGNQIILSKHLYFPENMNNKYNKNYIDTWFIDNFYGKMDKMLMNNIIDDAISMYRYVNEFAMWLSNTLSIKDDLDLMNENEEVRDIFHTDLSGVPLEQFNKTAMERSQRLIDIIKTSPNHWAGEMFRTGEGINPKQFKENAVSVGPKPNGTGSIYPIPINANLLYLGALKDLAYAIIDYCGGRLAQIINHTNVGKSGSFARISKLNNSDVYLNKDPRYVCDTKNFIKIDIKNNTILESFDGMVYRTNTLGVDRVLDKKNKSLINKTLYFRTPATCASNSRGDGICWACYGKLSFLNEDINIGVLAAEEFSSKLTQMLLQAKHILEAAVKGLGFSDKFNEYFKVNFNEIIVNPKVKFDKLSIVIDTNPDEDIQTIDEYDDNGFNYYMSVVLLKDKTGNIIELDSPTYLYITDEFMSIINENKNSDGISEIPLSNINESLFMVDVSNDELSEVLNKLQKIIDNSKITPKYTKDEILQDFVETIISSKMYINTVHCGVILSEQIRDKHDITKKPDWSIPDVEYQIIPMKASLRHSGSITKRLSYSYIDKALTTPSSFKVNSPSQMDLFFMTQPQVYIDPDFYIDDNNEIKDMLVRIDKDEEE